jgi:homoserine O-succinyltransferase/O-acetyltransferase
MKLLVSRGESREWWTEGVYQGPSEMTDQREEQTKVLEIALVNNMPDGAVEDTENQFCRLLSSVTDGIPVHVRFYTLPSVSRTPKLHRYIEEHYTSFDSLFSHSVDGAIITGTEPRQPDLKKESYWPEMVDLLNWSEENTNSTILSCLAAHAGILHIDGIVRTPLPDKQFGVFEYQKASGHPLTTGGREVMRFPHSRWNGVQEEALRSAGYSVLTRSNECGVDIFVKERKKALFVHFQGHPEYEARTLLKEYRRDVRRYLKGEREKYPSLPRGYFDGAMVDALVKFRAIALVQRTEETMEMFPGETSFAALRNGWQESATQIYGNWLGYLAGRKRDRRSTSVSVG